MIGSHPLDRSRSLIYLGMIGLFASLVGCATPSIPFPFPEEKPLTLDRLLSLYQQQRETIQNLKGLMEVTPSLPHRKIRQSFHATWVSDPHQVKIEGYHFLGGPLFQLQISEETASLVIPSRGLHTEMRREDLEEIIEEKLPLGPLTWLEWIRYGGIPHLHPKEVASLESEGEFLVMSLSTIEEGTLRLGRKIWIERHRLLAMKAVIFDSAGDPVFTLTLGDHRKLQSLWIPFQIEGEGPAGKIRLKMIDLRLNQEETKPVSLQETDEAFSD